MGFNQVQLLAHIFLFHITVGSEVIVQVNTKRWIYYVPERFLSLTIDPLTLAAASPLTQESFNMAKGLSPSFVRLGGIGTNAVYFGKKFMENSTTVSESQWDSVNDFAKMTGMDIIASLNPSVQSEGAWDSKNSYELISYSNRKRFGVAWQLGYDMRGYNASGAEVGKDLTRLRKMLDGFSNYANSPVFGPDVTSVTGAKQIRFVKDLLTNSGNPLACLILRPNFKNDAEPEDCIDLMGSMMNELDTYVWNKGLGKSVPKKPVWIAEPTASQGSFREAMRFAKRIGHAARLGVQIYLRQAGANTLKSPTPDYWFSLLYKNLVGQGVLDYKILARNQTGLHVFSHCTAAIPQDKSVLDTDWNYEKGAVTLFGVNESPEPTKLVIKATNKEEPIHIYTLTSAKKNEISPNKMAATLLNGQELKLSPTWDLPVLSPKVKKPTKTSSVTIPGDSIFFVVMPDSRVRTCSVVPISTPDLNLSELTKRLRLAPQKKAEESQEDKEEEDPQSEEGIYVRFAKKKRKEPETPQKVDALGKTLMRTIITKLAPKKVDLKTETDQEEMPVKYITFNENSFLNKLADGVKDELKEEEKEEEEELPESGNSNPDNKPKYSALTEAIKNPKADQISKTAVAKGSDGTDMMGKNGKIDVIAIEPLSVGTIGKEDDGRKSRKRRSSTEEPTKDTPSADSKPMQILKDLIEAKKKGTPMSDEISDVDRNLSQVNVTWKLQEGENVDKARTARHASLEQIGSSKNEEATDFGPHMSQHGQELTDESLKERLRVLNTQDAGRDKPIVYEPKEDKQRNVRHIGDAPEEKESITEAEDSKVKDGDQQAEDLARIVEQTEQNSTVSERPEIVMIPDGVPQEKLEDMMLKDAQMKSDPEPDGNPIKDETSKANPTASEPAEETVNSKIEQPAETPPGVPMLLLPAQQFNTPPVVTIGQTTNQNSPLPSEYNPMVVPSQPNLLMMPNEDDNIQRIPLLVQESDLPTPNNEDNNVPIINPPIAQVSPAAPNIEKENSISKVLMKIAREENSALAKLPTDGLKPGIVKEMEPSKVVPINVGGEPVLIPLEDLTALKQPDEKAEGKPSMKDGRGKSDGEMESGAQTLLDSEQQLELASEDSSQPSVKLPRQVNVKLPISPIAATPKSTTATLAAPLEEMAPTTPGPVSQFPPTKDSKPSSANQLPSMKPPTPEELRERYKVLREKMLELRQQYLEARDKRLEEFRKQVAMARTTPGTEDTIKSTIKRRETELKEWFKRLDKRELDPSQPILKENIPKSRPRRLSMFTNDENLDMEKFFEDEEPIETYNYKRSPEIGSSRQILPTPANIQTPQNYGKLVIPLESRSPQKIVYNNRVYPARLFGYIDPQRSYGMIHEPISINGGKEMGKISEYEVTEKTDDLSPPISRERLAYVPKDAFIKEFKSDFVPVLLLDPQEPPKTGRSKRSTLTDLEDQFHRVKDEIFPKINSWIKNLRDHPPWKRDLDRSSRTRRSVQNVLLANDIRSFKHQLKPLPNHAKDALEKAPEVEDFVLQNIDKGESELYKVAKEYTGLAEQIDKSLSGPKPDDSTENGYCEEIGTSGKSIIRDPFADKSEKSSHGSITEQTTGSRSQESAAGDSKIDQTKSDLSKSLEDQSSKESPSDESNRKQYSNCDSVIEDIFASIVADKIREFFSTIQSFMGASERK